jgi:hypothetical protein
MSWVPRQQRGKMIFPRPQGLEYREDIVVQTGALYVRNLRIETVGTKKTPFVANLSQSCIPYWEQAANPEHVWRTPFRVYFSPEMMIACYITVIFPNSVPEQIEFSYTITWEESREPPPNVFELGPTNSKLPEPVAARL